MERTARLTYPRLRECLDELRCAGLLGPTLEITERGYAFLQDVSAKVTPVMMKYGLWQGSR